MQLALIDQIVILTYLVGIIFLGWWISRVKKGERRDSEDFFLAKRNLPWWVVGASLIASNISAEQFIGMSGSGYAVGLAIASYEWMAAATLIIVGKWILPILLERRIFTMPEFLERRFDGRVRITMAVYWLLVYVFVNLTSVLYLGALALRAVTGVDLIYSILAMAALAGFFTIYGGLRTVVYTEVPQVVLLVLGGLVTTFVGLNVLSNGQGIVAGFDRLLEMAPQKFDMILSRDNPHYMDLPGLSVLIGGMWIANLSYWGFNQYITQRALAARNLKEAQRGVLFAGYLKLLMPLIVVVPGIIAFALQAQIGKPDEAYPWLLGQFVPAGLKGLALAALFAAIVSAISSMTNSTATIFSIDLYKRVIRPNASDHEVVATGRWVSAAALLIAVLVAPALSSLDQAFQYIQEYTGFVSPGVLAIFVMAFFYKPTTANAALAGAVSSIPLSALLKFAFPALPFLDRMGVAFLLLVALMVVVSAVDRPAARALARERSIRLAGISFRTDAVFTAGSIGILLILSFLYIRFW